MTEASVSAVDDKFWQIFNRVMGTQFDPGTYSVESTAPWDSLRHVELMFELEEGFGIGITSDEIVKLYSDTDTIRAFLAGSLTTNAG